MTTCPQCCQRPDSISEASSRQRQWLCKRSALLGLPHSKGNPCLYVSTYEKHSCEASNPRTSALVSECKRHGYHFLHEVDDGQSMCLDDHTLDKSTLDTAEYCIALVLDAMSRLGSNMTWHGTLQNRRAIFLLLSLQRSCFTKTLPVSMNS